jgi:hypothetical protein
MPDDNICISCYEQEVVPESFIMESDRDWDDYV